MLSRTVESFDEMFDVIVVGYGFGGAVSALSAHDAGAEVLLAEKMSNPGGISICSGGGLRLPHDRDATFKYLKATNDGTTPDNILEAFMDEMVQIDEYVQELATVNGARIMLDNGAWGLVRASSNTPNLVVVCESPESDAELRQIFADLDAVIRTEPLVGAYDQTL